MLANPGKHGELFRMPGRAPPVAHEPALPEALAAVPGESQRAEVLSRSFGVHGRDFRVRSEEHTSELQSRRDLVCRLLLEKKKKKKQPISKNKSKKRIRIKQVTSRIT